MPAGPKKTGYGGGKYDFDPSVLTITILIFIILCGITGFYAARENVKERQAEKAKLCTCECPK